MPNVLAKHLKLSTLISPREGTSIGSGGYQHDIALSLKSSPSSSPSPPPPQSLETISQRVPLRVKPKFNYNTALSPWKLPAHLMAQLEEWFERYPVERPPFTSGKSTHILRSVRLCKAVDRDYSGVCQQQIVVTKPAMKSMPVPVLRFPDGKECFARNEPRSHTTYLYAWLGLDQGFERDACAVRRFGQSLDQIDFSPKIWECAPDIDLNYKLLGRSSSRQSPDVPPVSEAGHESRTHSEDDDERAVARPRKSRRLQNPMRRQPGVLSPTPEVLIDPRGISRGVRESAQSHGPATAAPAAAENPSTNATGPTTTSTDKRKRAPGSERRRKERPTGVRFKFICTRTHAERVSTLRPGEGEKFFSRGKRIFEESNPEANVSKLICFVPSQNKARNLFDDDYEEVDEFIEEMLEYQKTTGNAEAIEVRYQSG